MGCRKVCLLEIKEKMVMKIRGKFIGMKSKSEPRDLPYGRRWHRPLGAINQFGVAVIDGKIVKRENMAGKVVVVKPPSI